MDTFYRCIIENNTFNDILKCLLDEKKILIINDDNDTSPQLSEILNIFNNYIFVGSFDLNLENFNYDLNFKGLNNNIKKLEMLQRKIKHTSDKIITIFNEFSSSNTLLNSLNNLYIDTVSNIEFKDEEFKFFNILKTSDFTINESSSLVINASENILKNGIIERFIKYKKYINSSRFKFLNESADEKSIELAINKLSSIINNSYAFIPPLIFNKYTDDFINESIYYTNLTDESLKDKVKIINSKHNGALLNKINATPKFSFKYIFNSKKIKEANANLLKEYLAEESKIYEEYLDNIENLNIYINSFSFIKDLFNDDIFNNIKYHLLQEDELQSYILKLKNILVSYKNYLGIKKNIESSNVLELNILNYCYKYYTKKDSLKNIILFIPKFYLYSSIYDIESKKSHTIKNYHNTENFLNSLYSSINIFKSLLRDTLIKYSSKHFYKTLALNKVSKESFLEELSTYLKYNTYTNESFFQIYKSIFPIAILNKKNAIKYYDNYEEYFDVIINSSDIQLLDAKEYTVNPTILHDKILKDILKIPLSLNYPTSTYDNVISIKNNTIIYVNTTNPFSKEDLINIIKLKSSYSNIIFIWIRDWWINKNETIKNIQNYLLKSH